MSLPKFNSCFLFFIFVVIVYAKPILADPVVVYGGLIEQQLHNEASSISLLEGSALRQAERKHLEQAVSLVPNLNLSSGSSRARYFQIRGIGERSAYEGMPNHSVGVVIDDIDYSGISGVAHMAGIEQLEVYKGPQATRMGPSAMAGMIHMKSMDASSMSAPFHLSLSRSSFKTWESSFSTKWTPTEKLRMALHLGHVSSEGFYENTYLKREDTNHQNEVSLKLVADWKNEETLFKLSLHHFDFDNGYDAFSHDNSYQTKSDRPGQDDQRTTAASLRVETDLLPSLKSTTLLSMLHSEGLYSYEEDWGNNPGWQNVPGWNKAYDYRIEFLKDREDFAVDQRFIHQQTLIIGLYAKHSTEDFLERGFNQESIRKNLRGDYKTKNYALYFENENFIGTRTSFLYGARAELREAEFNDSQQNSFSPDEFMQGGHVAVQYEHENFGMSYLKLSQGFKAGGVNTQAAVEKERKEFEQEKLVSLEYGHKYNKNQLELNFSVFHMWRNDVQVQTSYQDDPSDPSSYTFYTDNATSGRSWGGEFEVNSREVKGFSWAGQLGVLETRYGDYSYSEKNLKGREFPHAPEYQFGLQLKYRAEKGFFTELQTFFQDNFYFSNSHSKRARAYQNVDFMVGWKNKKYRLSFWVKNLFQERIEQRGFYFSNEPPNWDEKLYVQRGSPRRLGVTFDYWPSF